jgi:hypothetical protein
MSIRLRAVGHALGANSKFLTLHHAVFPVYYLGRAQSLDIMLSSALEVTAIHEPRLSKQQINPWSFRVSSCNILLQLLSGAIVIDAVCGHLPADHVWR